MLYFITKARICKHLLSFCDIFCLLKKFTNKHCISGRFMVKYTIHKLGTEQIFPQLYLSLIFNAIFTENFYEYT